MMIRIKRARMVFFVGSKYMSNYQGRHPEGCLCDDCLEAEVLRIAEEGVRQG